MFEQDHNLPQQLTASSEADSDPYSEDVLPKRQKKGKQKRTNSRDDDEIGELRRLDMVENAPRIRGTWVTRSKKKTSHQVSVEDEAEEDGDEIMFACMYVHVNSLTHSPPHTHTQTGSAKAKAWIMTTRSGWVQR